MNKAFAVIDCLRCDKKILVPADSNVDEVLKTVGWVKVTIKLDDKFVNKEFAIQWISGYICEECRKKLFLQ